MTRLAARYRQYSLITIATAIMPIIYRVMFAMSSLLVAVMAYY